MKQQQIQRQLQSAFDDELSKQDIKDLENMGLTKKEILKLNEMGFDFFSMEMLATENARFQGNNGDFNLAEFRESLEIAEKIGKDLTEFNLNSVKENAMQNVIGLLINEYYGKEDNFKKEGTLVKELQKNLNILDYELGDSGKNNNGVDGDLGALTKTAIGNFQQDYSTELKQAVSDKNQILEELSKVDRSR